MFQYKYIHIESCDLHRKNAFRNRCVVAGSNGLVTLTIPLEKGRDQRTVFRDVQISYRQNWQQQHWRTLASCYGNAPFFEYYAPAVQALLLEKKFTFLADLNLQILEWMKDITRSAMEIQPTAAFTKCHPAGVKDLRGSWGIAGGPAADSTPYYQLFADRIGFHPNLSMLDRLFCEGATGFPG